MEATNSTNIYEDKKMTGEQKSDPLPMIEIKEEIFSMIDNIDIKKEPIDDTETIDKVIKTGNSKANTHTYLSIKCEPVFKSEYEKPGDNSPSKTLKTEYIEYFNASDLKSEKKQKPRRVNSVTGGINLIESESCQEYKSRGRKGVFKIETGKSV